MAKKTQSKKTVTTLTYEEASRKNIPTAEYEAVLHEKDKGAIRVAYERRNRDLDPQLVWRGKLASDPGDLILDPTCGSGTTAYVVEQWCRRWIKIDISRVSLALARARIMGARYPYYLLGDSKGDLEKEAEITRTAPSTKPIQEDIRQGFVNERVPHIT